MRHRRLHIAWLGQCLAVFGVIQSFQSPAAESNPSPEGIEFFEKRVRPVLSESCYSCHSSKAEKLKGGLHLDSRAGMLMGGDTGPAVVPGNAEKSRLVEAIRYGNPDLQMPPKNKLTDAAIVALTEWINMGAPWPLEKAPAEVAGKKPAFDLEQRRQQHWCWQPARSQPLPTVHEQAWPIQRPDYFILARLEAAGLRPAPPAEKRTLVRRLYFDLIGLPPSPAEVEAFLADSSSTAYATVVERLLASPRFGERWARHWLDLVRYAETLGHEFDYANHNAWRYRDYVIRAWNADLPYDQFTLEHIAGDVLPEPRRHPTEGFNESIIGPSFYWLGQRDHSPVDVRLHQAEVIDNQIDVLTKTFLGLTVACARCHDHKFDAIATKDYYALYGVLSSSRYGQRSIEPPAGQRQTVKQLEATKAAIRAAVLETWSRAAASASNYLAAAAAATAPLPTASTNGDPSADLQQWINALRQPPPLLAELAALRPTTATPASSESNSVSFVDFARDDYRDWFVDGAAFGNRPARAGDFLVGSNQPIHTILSTPVAHSALLSRRLQGVLRSPTFRIEKRYVHVWAAGREARLNIPVDNLTMIRDPIYGVLKQVFHWDQPRWVTVNLDMWKGHSAYLEFNKSSTADPSDDGHRDGFAVDGWMSVQRVVFSDQATPPAAPNPTIAQSPDTGEAGQLGTISWPPTAPQLQKAIAAWREDRADAAQLALLNWVAQHRLLSPEPAHPSGQHLANLLADYRRLEADIKEPRRALSMVDGSGLNEHVFIRGNHKTPGEEVPRRFLEALSGPTQPTFREGSGRLSLARRVIDPASPLFSRVFVNRVWLHLFGRGLVPTPDDFGVLGQPPTHPELLDWLAHWFRTEGEWHPKELIKLLVTSRAYQMSSHPSDAAAEEKDPANQLWHRAEVRRLEGEAIRDSILAVSGRLDPTMFGPAVPIHLTEFMDGRGRPATSGPLDGEGRRSIYVEVRRNFVSPMMRAFDTPVPHSTVGRRTISNVPAQSLILLNDPFVLGQARIWAQRVLASGERASTDRIRDLYLMSFGRPPEASEQAEALAFLERQAASYRSEPATAAAAVDERVWADLCHVLWNVKEFVFIN